MTFMFWYTPIVKSALATKTYDVPNHWQDNSPGGIDTYYSWAPGYAFSGKTAAYALIKTRRDDDDGESRHAARTDLRRGVNQHEQ